MSMSTVGIIVLISSLLLGVIFRPSDRTGRSYFGDWMRRYGFWEEHK